MSNISQQANWEQNASCLSSLPGRRANTKILLANPPKPSQPGQSKQGSRRASRFPLDLAEGETEPAGPRVRASRSVGMLIPSQGGAQAGHLFSLPQSPFNVGEAKKSQIMIKHLCMYYFVYAPQQSCEISSIPILQMRTLRPGAIKGTEPGLSLGL